MHSDQTRFPAAMRTNLLFGDVRFDEDVKTAKEIERRQWLEDLQKQIEDNKRHKYTRQETERRQDFLNENVQPILQEAANRHQQQKEIPTTNHSDHHSSRFVLQLKLGHLRWRLWSPWQQLLYGQRESAPADPGRDNLPTQNRDAVQQRMDVSRVRSVLSRQRNWALPPSRGRLQQRRMLGQS